MGVAKGPWSPNYVNSIMCPHFANFEKRYYGSTVTVLRLSEHGDVIETQTVKIVPPQIFLANLVPATKYY